MADIKVIRQPTVANTKQIYNFDVKSFRFLVKNLTEDDILVALDEDATEDEMIFIPSETAQVVMAHENVSLINGSNTVTILLSITLTRVVFKRKIKEHIFITKYNLEEGYTNFYSDYEISLA